MSHVLATYANFPVTIVKGEGTWLWDDEGKRYLDFCSGIATCSIGHCHPKLTDAITKQSVSLIDMIIRLFFFSYFF